MTSVIEYEKLRLKEIYTLLFPNEHIFIQLKPSEIQDLKGPKNIKLNILAHAILNEYQIHIGPMHLPVSHSFEITIPSKNQSQENNFPISNTRKISYLLSSYPLLHETVLELIFNYLEMKQHIHFNKKYKTFPWKTDCTSEQTPTALVMMHWLDVGGAEKFAVETCLIMEKNNITPIVLSSRSSRPFYFEQLSHKYLIYELDRQIPLGKRLKFILLLIKHHKISIIHNHHSTHFYQVIALVKSFFRSIIAIDTLHIDEKKRNRLGFPRLSVIWTNYIDYHHVISKRLENFFLTHRIDKSKIIFGHLGKTLSYPSTFNIQNNLLNKKINICFVGRMVTQKRPILGAVLLIDAVAFLIKSNFETTVNIVGDGEHLKSFINAINKSGYAKYFKFFPSNTNVLTIMQQNDILLISSENEGITLVAYEALAQGCIVVSTDVGAQNEIVPQNLLLPSTIFKARNRWEKILLNLTTNEIFRENIFIEIKKKVDEMKQKQNAWEVLDQVYRDIYAKFNFK
ncbi:glycosyltransferase family 4 protein [Sulfuricurvum sp.]|uniref:glycosyltransferase family 4 protein n=1 Tax=Sulfuricurvum sp. TaxID=2025608 RepID=UPI00260BDA2C|nr:glycosyltransferase family 4 protein [Sulfuricurvum sp.]MDD2267527.1 glycosyltransferase family 4 protein [Sulfuricurvum sp.]MDD2783681.1 glycosyltransferase family 4 protein [Sulfuricurvum sp.]